MDFARDGFDRFPVHVVGDLGAKQCEVHHDDILGGVDKVFASGPGSPLPGSIDDFEKRLTHQAVIVAGEIHALFDAGAVGLDEAFPRYLIGDLGGVVVGEAAIEVLLKRGLQSSDADERVFRALVAHDAADFFFNRW